MNRGDDLAREVERLRDLLARLCEASLRINESLDLPTVLQGVLDSARLLTGARYGAITTLDDTGRMEDLLTSGLNPEEHRALFAMPDGAWIFEYLSGATEPLRIGDLPGHFKSLGVSDYRPPVEGDSFLGTPVRHLGVPVANFFLAGKEADAEFNAQDEETLVMFASQAAMVIANARRHRDEQRARTGLETLIDTSPVGVVVFDAATGSAVSVNREGKRIASLLDPDRSVEELLGTVDIRRADGTEFSLQELPVAEALNEGAAATAVRAEEIVIGVPDGPSVTALLNATPIVSEDGAVESFVVTLQDLTPLQDQDRLRAEFLAMVSHELRAPLAAIKGSAATVLGVPGSFGPAEMVGFLRIIDRQADQMSGLINDLLDVARIKTGTLPVNPEPSPVTALVDQARTAFATGGHSHNIRIELPPDLPAVMADPRRIIQVLSNLLSNAARHSPERSPIRVSAAAGDFHVAVSVTDQGSGIPADRLAHLFGNSVLRHSEGQGNDLSGPGLGLAICKGIVEAHGGRISADSDGPGHGAKFTFTIPAVEAAVAEADGPSPSPPAGSRRGEQVQILVVDDDPQALRHLHDTLSDAGYSPLATSDPAEALTLTADNDPHLALLDLVMPGTDGVELMKDIQAVADVPVIFLSAYGQQDVIARAFDSGADDYVVKPFSPTELAARIRAALRKRAPRAPEEPTEPYVRGDLVIDYAARRVNVAGGPVRLTAIEYRLLTELAANGGRTLTYRHLLKRVWDDRHGDSDLRPMRSAVRSLRRKLGDDANNPAYIFTEPRIGYRMPKATTQTQEETAE